MDKILNETFENLFHNLDSYEVIPKMLEKVSNDVIKSEFDCLKEHSICYHISGMVDTIFAAKKALITLVTEAKILEIDLTTEMDEDQFNKLVTLLNILNDNKAYLNKFDKNNTENECLHINSEVINNRGNGYFDLKCKDCGHTWIDG